MAGMGKAQEIVGKRAKDQMRADEAARKEAEEAAARPPAFDAPLDELVTGAPSVNDLLEQFKMPTAM